MSMIEIKHLKKSFGSLKIFEDLNFTVEKGEIVSIIGASGCGKSVFLRCIELLETPNSGVIKICGEEITKKGADIDKIRRKIGMVYQTFNLFSHLDVMDNLCLAPTRLLNMKRNDAEDKAKKLLKQVGLIDKIHVMPKSLSGGQKQRIAIARALMMEPEILLFDEPTSALDPTMVGEVLATIRMLSKRSLTMLIVTHEMKFAKDVSTRIVFLADYGIYEEGKPYDVLENPKKEKTIAFIRKIKNFIYKIDKRQYDLPELQGQLMYFCNKYGIGLKNTTRLSLCVEEMIEEYLRYGNLGEKVDMLIDIEFSEKYRDILVKFISVGNKYNPFENENDDIHLGVHIISKTSKEHLYSYISGVNEILFKFDEIR